MTHPTKSETSREVAALMGNKLFSFKVGRGKHTRLHKIHIPMTPEKTSSVQNLHHM
jgi:hypothetical protein